MGTTALFVLISLLQDVTREDVKKKLSLVVKTAKAVWSDA